MRRRLPWIAAPAALATSLVLAACLVVPVPASDPAPNTAGARARGASQHRQPKPAPRVHAPSSRPVPRPAAPLRLAEAREYVRALVNRDRAAAGLEPLAADDVAARAGQRHAEDMAAHGFTAHPGTDGSVPEQRHTEAGGTGFAQENAACFFDGKLRELDPDPRFDPSELEKIEAAFLNERPPHDGHRRNLLTPWHTHFGVGLARAKGVKVPCMSQELTDHYGAVEPLPPSARAGARVHVAGTVESPARFGGIGVARIDMPGPRSVDDLNATAGYMVPKPHVTYFPRGFVTPAPVKVEGREYAIDVPLDRGPGLYEISVFAELPEADHLTMIGLRTLRVQ